MQYQHVFEVAFTFTSEIDRINTKKSINKYFKKIRENGKLEEGADIVIDYLEQFKPKFISSLQSFEDKIKDYKEK